MSIYKKAFKIISDSMLPLINKGDIVFVEDAHHRDFSTGDIVCIKHKNKFIIHRLYSINGDFIFQSGDSNIGWMKNRKSEIIGKVVLILKLPGLYILTSGFFSKTLAVIFIKLRNISPRLKQGTAQLLTSLTPLWIEVIIFYQKFKRKIRNGF